MTKFKKVSISFLLFLVVLKATAQQIDLAGKKMTYSGTLGVTTNAFSIIPSFSLNSPGLIALLSWKKNKFSIDPDVRLSPDLRKGGILLWFRYMAVDKKKFTLRVGAHPGLNLQNRVLAENGANSAITQMRRFLAWELVPNYKIKDNWTIGMYYLQGNGLQKDGPRTTHFVTFNTGISNIKLGKQLGFGFYPAVYYLYLDAYEGKYLTATAALTHRKLPVYLEYTINKTFSSTLPGNKDFMWCLTLKYNFTKTFVKIN